MLSSCGLADLKDVDLARAAARDLWRLASMEPAPGEPYIVSD